MEIELKGNRARIGYDQFVPITDFCQTIAAHSLTGMREKPIPDQVKWIVEKGNKAVYIVELPPGLQSIQCDLVYEGCNCEACRLSRGDLGPEESAVGRFAIATPYVILKVPFWGNAVQEYIEVFYRNQPLKSIDDKLYLTNLPNTGAAGGEHNGWLCVDGLNAGGLKSREAVINKLVNHLWGGEFNSEVTNSRFHQFREEDPRLATMHAWQEHSLKDPSFVLGVKWTDSGRTVRRVIEGQLEKLTSYEPAPGSAHRLGDLLLAN